MASAEWEQVGGKKRGKKNLNYCLFPYSKSQPVAVRRRAHTERPAALSHRLHRLEDPGGSEHVNMSVSDFGERFFHLSEVGPFREIQWL